ncbi:MULTISPECIES: sigma-70 family RNA polymerase sigma factor [unclassified Agarivorans]|uniref:sigma-70 family RNA polymerase sigma factor n=1 Tax=unclassified Agarivorans TaxID=2636026 RepID=UPI0010DC034D|nr:MULTISPECIES: sigma-70 family RNA polymerase sigma factor [unclassified Agarivorans]MDO6684736.1 sigma-70 family RNA polymerase sigma factor [Agarivorans sp. 3_MG-2023]MDO6715103.1 sigma-70 family RNA polymerase sigma factor [Agarivorans sp. 2_MG-2023]MDO6763978.1 sigma-70 family RNA polymerase sigma factor [Agarivorans sp. 1_MG-2023]GDY27905.1 RNA polymerase sigma factor [Agarivorans sp. Toyoura001]
MVVDFFRKKNQTDSVMSDMEAKQKRYEALVQAYNRDVYRYAYWLVKDKHIAEDIVQETFLRAWRSLDSLKDEKAAKAWLITILRRENARRFERKQFNLVDIEDHSVADVNATSTEQQIENEWLRRQIDKLAPEYKEPLLLQVIGGFSGDEIADMLELNKNTVMTRLFRARNQLKEALEDDQNRGQSNG